MRPRLVPALLAALVLPFTALAPASAAPAVNCYFTYTGGTANWTETVSLPGGSVTATENPRTAKVAQGGSFSFAFPNIYKPGRAHLNVTRNITYTASDGKIRTIKRVTRVPRFDPARSVALPDLRIAGTLVSQNITFATPYRAPTWYSCDYTSPAA